MGASRVVQVRVSSEVQEAASEVIEAAGLTVGDVLRVFMAQIARDRALPLDLFAAGVTTKAAFVEAEQGELTRFSTVDALFDDLHADD